MIGKSRQFSVAASQELTEAMDKLNSEKARPMAEVSHLFALIADRLSAATAASGPERACLVHAELQGILTMLREAQNAAHAEYQKNRGSEEYYQNVGKKVASRFRTPGGRWRSHPLAPSKGAYGS